MSPSAAAPNSASVIAWQSASASEWPIRPCVCGDLDAAEDELAALDEGVRVPALADAPDRAARLHACRVRAREQAPRRSRNRPAWVDLEVLRASPATSRGAGPAPRSRAASSVASRRRAPARRPARRAGTSAASAPARAASRGSVAGDAAARARASACRRPAARAGRRPRSSPQASISASIHSARTRQRAASWTSTQSSARGAEPARARRGRRRRSRRASRRRSARRRDARRGQRRRGARSASSSGASDDQDARRGARRRPAPPACGRPAAGRRSRRTAWRPVAPARTPLPAHGTSAIEAAAVGRLGRHRRSTHRGRARQG